MTLYELNNVQATFDLPESFQPETIPFPLRIRELCQTCRGRNSLILRYLGSLETLLPNVQSVPLTILLPLIALSRLAVISVITND